MGSQLAIPARLLSVLGAGLALAAVLCGTPPALAQPPSKDDEEQAQVLVKKGLEAYAASDYGTAASAFEEAYQLAPNQQTLFAWAQAERLRGNCRRALDLFARLLEGELSKENRNAVRTSMTECERRVAEEARAAREHAEATESEVTPPDTGPDRSDQGDAPSETTSTGDSQASDSSSQPADTSPDVARASSGPPDTGDSNPAWYKDPVGGILTGAGLVGLGVGIGLYISASSANDAAAAAGTYSEFSSARDRAESRGRLSVISATAGAVLVGAGITWYVLGRGQRGEARDRSAGLSPWWQPGAAGVTWLGSF